MANFKFKRPSHGHGSYHSAINGVTAYIHRNHEQLLKGNDPKFYSKANSLMQEFLKYKGIKYAEKNTEKSLYDNANLVQDNWQEFKEYLKAVNL